MKNNKEFQKFDKAMQQLMKVPHSKVKAKLKAEKLAKQQKRTAKPSASDRASCERD